MTRPRFARPRWLLLGWLRRLEIRQIEARLAEETRRQEQLETGAAATARAEFDLTRRQVDFLRQKRVWLTGELESLRRRLFGQAA